MRIASVFIVSWSSSALVLEGASKYLWYPTFVMSHVYCIATAITKESISTTSSACSRAHTVEKYLADWLRHQGSTRNLLYFPFCVRHSKVYCTSSAFVITTATLRVCSVVNTGSTVPSVYPHFNAPKRKPSRELLLSE